MTQPVGSLFLGPAGENAEIVERFIVEALRDHVFWRRNFHPEDGPFIAEREKRAEAFEGSVVTLRQELYRLLARLKHGAPFFSPRYIGHMVSDTMIASLVGYFAAMLYNPNNISGEGAPVTMELELEVGEELARLVGYGPAAWGHLSSGGSVANIEALWAARALKYFPPLAAMAVRALALPEPLVARPDGTRAPLTSLSAWELMNVSGTAALDLKGELVSHVEARPDLATYLAEHGIGAQGYMGFYRAFEAACGEQLSEPVLLLPSTKHYSWVKIANLLGFGQSQLVELPLDADYRIDPARFAEVLEDLAARRVPVLALVAVLGSTETGSVDGLHRLLDARSAAERRGVTFFCHVDAAYGGYAAAMFRDPQGAWTGTGELAESFAALARTESVTIDPHKLGYIHYPAGAIVFADRRVRELVAADAPYVFHDGDHANAIGQYIVEGSKPGAAAAAVWLSHRVAALDTSGYGALIGRTVASARSLQAALAAHVSPRGFELVPLNEPHLNLVTFLALPPDVERLADLNRFNEALYRRFAPTPERLVFTYDFQLSKTAFDVKKYAAGLRARLDARLVPLLEEGPAVTVLRATIMNPFIPASVDSGAYAHELLEVLEREMQAAWAAIAPTSRRHPGSAGILPA